jgi:glutathione S-transferase
MNWVWVVISLALIEYMIFAVMVSRARQQFGIDAPATTGHPTLERWFRIHQNTLEVLIIFVPGMLMFARFVSLQAALGLGLLFIISRIVYAIGYLRDPKGRAPGSIATFVINVVLVVGGLIGALLHS